jgi:hypothetical protein
VHTSDWLASTLVARDDADLTQPASWTLAAPALHPAARLGAAWHTLTGSSFSVSSNAQTGLMGYRPPAPFPSPLALKLGVGGGLRWGPGAAVRMQDRRGDGLVRPAPAHSVFLLQSYRKCASQM